MFHLTVTVGVCLTLDKCVWSAAVIYTVQQALVMERAPVVRQQLSLLTDGHLRDTRFVLWELPASLLAKAPFRKDFQIILALRQLVEFSQWLFELSVDPVFGKY